MTERDIEEVIRTIATVPSLRAQLVAVINDRPARLLFTTRTLAEELGVSERAIRRAIEAGDLSATRRVGRWVITADDALAWATTGTKKQRPRVVNSSRRKRTDTGGLTGLVSEMDQRAA